MSAYKIIKANLQTKEAAIAALLALGFKEEEIEVYDIARPLLRYEGSQSGKANVIVRQKNVNRVLSGGASNDIGVEFSPEGTKIHISDYDEKWWKNKKAQFFEAGVEVDLKNKAKKLGYKVKKIKKGKQTVLQLVKTY